MSRKQKGDVAVNVLAGVIATAIFAAVLALRLFFLGLGIYLVLRLVCWFGVGAVCGWIGGGS